jgi:hypothetical protein
MPLIFSGQQARTSFDYSFQASDAETKTPVRVKVSREALEDYGVDKVKIIANSKYDGGKIDSDGGVTVHTADCK